jgi:hypothetical protein
METKEGLKVRFLGVGYSSRGKFASSMVKGYNPRAMGKYLQLSPDSRASVSNTNVCKW